MPTSGPHPQLTVQNSVIHYTSGGDVLIKPSSGVSAQAVFKHALVQKSGGFGIRSDSTAGGIVRTVISDSTLDYLTDFAILAVSTGTSVNVMVEHTVISNAGSSAPPAPPVGGGVSSDGPQARIRLNNSTITNTATGVLTVNGGMVISYGNNAINAPIVGTLTPMTLQ